MARDYAKEYKNYHSRPEQIKKRSSRNKARRLAVKMGKAKKGDGKDIHHRDGNPLNNKNIIGSRTAEFMMSNHLEKDVDLYDIAKGKWGTNIGKGVGFSLGGSVILDPIKNMSLISKDSFSWGGAASTLFWVDPIEKISVVFMTQMLGNPLSQEIRADLRNLVYQALI